MKRCYTVFIPILVISILFSCPGYSLSEGIMSGDQEIVKEPIEITADRLAFDRKKNIYSTQGNVEIVQGKRIITADTIKVNIETNDAEADGSITLIDGQDLLKCDRMEFNLESQRGTIHNGRLFFKEENFYIAGEKIEKLGKDTYRIIDGSFTSCDGPSPPWRFTGKEVNVTMDGYATVKHAAFYLKDIPVLYLPYMIYPAKTKRQTGFLIPHIGYSNEGGGEINLPFFWAISKNKDATFSLDYRGKRGIGEELEYRHVFSRNSSGNLYLFHMNEKDSYRDMREERKGEKLISDPDRWILKYRHEHLFDPSFSAKVDVTDISDRDFYRDFGEIVDDRSKEKLESTVFLAKNWQRLNLNSEFRYTEDLEKDDNTTLQTLPRVEFAGVQQRISSLPLFYNFTSTFDNFWREEGQTGQRIDVYPKILYTFHTDYFALEPEFGARETVYKLDEEEDRFYNREIYDFNLGLSTAVQKIFDIDGKRVKKVKHSIKPELVYTFIPKVDQEDLPDFDSVDRIDRNNSITYSLTNDLIGKIFGGTGNGYYHDFARLKLSQSYDFIEARRGLTSSSDSRRPLSAISGELDIYPNQHISLELDGKYDTYERRFTTYNILIGLKDERGDSLDFEYRNTKDELEDINTKLGVKILDSLDLKIENRYSVFNDLSLETTLGIEYMSQCWGVMVTYSDRAIEEEDRREQKYMVIFTLAGLGEFGR